MDRLMAAQVFVEVVQRASQTAAAEHLGLSRAMVSRYLASLEDWLGSRLLHRTTRRLSLTDAGEELLPLCRELLANAEAMRAVGQNRAGQPQGTLRVACSQSLAQVWLVQAVAAFVERYPAVKIDLLVSSEAVNLVEERVDLALRITNQLDPNLVARQLGTCHSVVCASPAYLQQHGTPLHIDDLQRHNCLTYTYFGRSLWTFVRAGEPCSVAVAGRISSNEALVLMEACLAGGGICLLPRYAAAPLLASGQLQALLSDYQPQALGIHALYGTRRQMQPALRALLDFLAQTSSAPWAL